MTGQTHGKPRPVVLFGGFGGGNIGNNVSAQVAIDVLREADPERELLIATPFPEGAELRFGLRAVDSQRSLSRVRGGGSAPRRLLIAALTEVRTLGRVARLLRSCSAVVVPGTGILDDFAERPWAMPYALFSWALLARLVGCPFTFLAVGAGPINSSLNRVLMLGAVRLASGISVRDEPSRDFLRRNRIRGSIPVLVDLAFALADRPAEPAEPSRQPCRVGVGLIYYDGWAGTSQETYQTYVLVWAELIRRLVGQGHQVRLLIGQPIDRDAVADVLAECGPAAAGVEVPEIDDFDDLRAAVDTLDVVIATRYHNVVAALLADRPVVSAGYAAKNDALLRRFGYQGMDFLVEAVDADWLLERLAELRSGEQPCHPGVRLRADWRAQVVQAIRGAALTPPATRPRSPRRAAR